MRRLLLAVLLAATSAQAGWTPLTTLGGTPQDVTVADGGVVVAVSSGTGGRVVAYERAAFAWTPFVDESRATAVSADMLPGGCVVTLTTTGQMLLSPSTCGTASSLGGDGFSRVRVAPSGLMLVRFNSTTSSDGLATALTPAGPWTALASTWTATAPRTLEVTRVGGVDYAVMNASASALQVSTDGGLPTSVALPGVARAAAPFERLGVPAVIAVLQTGGVWRIDDVRNSVAVVFGVVLPTGTEARDVAMTTAGGSAAGRGYGLISTTTGQLYSPVPDPTQPGDVWVERTGVAPNNVERVACWGATVCATLGSDGQLWALSNDEAPTLSVDAGVLTPGTPSTLSAQVADLDGDPVFVSWAASVGTIVRGSDVQGRLATLMVPAGTECTRQTVPVLVTVSDGLAAHDTSLPLSLPLVSQAQAWVSPQSLTATAGASPVPFTGGTDGGCAGGAIAWSSTDGQTGSGANFSWAVPPAVCDAAGAAYTVSMSWTGGSGTLLGASAAVHVDPWGAPAAPAFAGGTQPAGGTVVWAPAAAPHACEGAAGFPGTELTWTWPPPPAGVSLEAVDGGLAVSAPDVCTRATVTASAVSNVVGLPAQASGAGALTVQVVPAPPPLGAQTPFDIALSGDGGSISGVFSVDAGCRPLELLSGEVSLYVPDASVVASTGLLPVPGPWSLEVPASCGQGRFDAVGRLYDEGLDTGAFVSTSVGAPTLPVLPGVASPDALEVRCGAGVVGALHVESAAGGCRTPLATWRQTGGPPLEQSTLEGADVEVRSTSKGLDLVGQTLRLEVTVGDGAGASAAGTHEVRLEVAPFVEIEESMEPFPSREEDSLTVAVRLRNATACDVDGLELRLGVSGLVVALESLRLDGAPVVGEVRDGVLVIQGLGVAGAQTRRVTFNARRRLLGQPEARGAVFLAGQEVSFRGGTAESPRGCGCGAAGAPAWLALALVWWGALRRKETRRRRDD